MSGRIKSPEAIARKRAYDRRHKLLNRQRQRDNERQRRARKLAENPRWSADRSRAFREENPDYNASACRRWYVRATWNAWARTCAASRARRSQAIS